MDGRMGAGGGGGMLILIFVGVWIYNIIFDKKP